MKIKVKKAAVSYNKVLDSPEFEFETHLEVNKSLKIDGYAYPPFINSHDHLIGNWYPKAGKGKLYDNSNVWVEDMKTSEAVLERNKFWKNDGSFNLLKGKAFKVAQLGMYKNLFSGVGSVQDHIPIQEKSYYEMFSINVIREYRQCHSVILGNWWGGESIIEEMNLTKGKMPFIIHLGEGKDSQTKNEFAKLKELGLLQKNLVIAHGISLSEEELKECRDVGASIIWMPNSNMFLIGETLDIKTCLKLGVNVAIGTDSALTGSANLLSEIKFAKNNFPEIDVKTIFKMITENAQKAMMLSKDKATLATNTGNILIFDSKTDNIYENLLEVNCLSIKFFALNGTPLYGDRKYLDDFAVHRNSYYFFEKNGRRKFVFGHPEKITNEINNVLGYKKKFPYIPFD